VNKEEIFEIEKVEILRPYFSFPLTQQLHVHQALSLIRVLENTSIHSAAVTEATTCLCYFLLPYSLSQQDKLPLYLEYQIYIIS